MPLKVRDIGALKLYNAVRDGHVDSVESLLASGVNPNTRMMDWDPVVSDMQTLIPPEFFSDEFQFPSLLKAAKCKVRRSGTFERSKTRELVKALLDHNADPYALFPQYICTHPNVPRFPGEVPDEEWIDEDVDLRAVRRAHKAALRTALRDERRRQLLADGVPSTKAEELAGPDFEKRDDESAMEYEPRFARKEGACSVIHAMLVKGIFVQPVIEFLGNKLDIERRDPQGQTLFLAACRSKIGLDGAVDSIYGGFCGSGEFQGICDNPFPQPDNPWKEFENQDTTSVCTGPTLLEFFMARGADLLAIDNYGQNALHHLLGCFNRSTHYGPPVIDISLKYLLKNCPGLINQPTNAGIYPLQLALRRMEFAHSWSEDDVPSSILHYETVVYDLLAENADPLVRDGHGNTVLHYLGGTVLGESVRMGVEQRRLLRVFVDRGVDVNARNKDGATALGLFFTTASDEMSEEFGDEEVFGPIANEVLGIFEKTGYDILAKNKNGQSLLHLVAGLKSYRTDAWFELLQKKGVDPMAHDNDGRTPVDIAKENEHVYLFR